LISPDLQPGLQFEDVFRVEDFMTVPRLYPTVEFCADMPDVLATGYMVGIMELTCTRAIMRYVDWPRVQSVGTMVNFTHTAATPPGMTLRIKGEVLEVDGRRLKFRVEAWDDHDKICEGTHERFVIDPAKFNGKLADKKTKAGL
jgi:fluoroacetyl-CoA thioesterase